MPNRSTLMTGRMPTAHGVIMNDRSLDWGANTYVRSLRQDGYRTGLFGKSHLQHGMSRNSVLASKRAPAVADPWPPGWDQLEDHEHYETGLPEWPDDFYGFDQVELSIDHGARVTGHHLQWALDRGGTYEDLVVPLTAESPALRRSDRWWQVYQPPIGPELHSTTFVSERTSAFIEEAAAEDKPWCAWASFPDPHHPFAPPGEWFDRHRPGDMELPSTIGDPLAHGPAYLRQIQRVHPADQHGWVGFCGAPDHDLVRESLAATYGMIEFLDHGVGQIVATIERLGQLDNTIVVFTSDHGDMMGDHGLMLKGYMHYRGTLQVPLVIADPRRSAGRSNSLVGSIDLAQTLLDLTGLRAYDGMQGMSLVPVLDDVDAPAHEVLLIEDDLPDGLARYLPVPAKTRTVLTSDGMKYTRHSTGEDQLFDLTADRDELHQVAAHDPARRAAAIEILADALIANMDAARGAPTTASLAAKESS
ncbi:MAG: sulfatase-like hydrolase/transferase [Acidimicrobiales bacterium]